MLYIQYKHKLAPRHFRINFMHNRFARKTHKIKHYFFNAYHSHLILAASKGIPSA